MNLRSTRKLLEAPPAKLVGVIAVRSTIPSVSHLLHTKRPSHLRALLDKLGNIEGEILDRLIDLNGVPGAAGGKFTVAAMAEINTLWPWL